MLVGSFSKARILSQRTRGHTSLKRHGNLYEKVYDIENLRQAHANARKGKTHYVEVVMVDSNVDKYLYEIQDMLKNKTFRTSRYINKIINDTGKERKISKLPYYPDRIVQWAIMLHVEDILLKTMITQTYAALPGRGIHPALFKLNEYMKDREGTHYCLKFDIKKFFPSIDKEILKRLIRKKIKDPQLLWLMDEIIDSYPEGIPIGNYTSQYLANFYLTYFDHWVKEQLKVKYYLRYMDDCVLLHESKEQLHVWKREIENYLTEHLKLEIKGDWQVFPTYVRGVDFVGYRSFGDYTLLRKTIATKLKRKMRAIKKDGFTSGYVSSVGSYYGWIIHCNGFNLYKKYIKPILPKGVDLDESKFRRSPG